MPSTEQAILDADDPILFIKVKYEREDVQIFEDNESTILDYITAKDLDIVVFKNQDLDILSYLLIRTKVLH